MSGADVIEASLEAVVGDGLDIVPFFFARFFAAHPDQQHNFQRPQATQGAMVNEMLDYLIAIDGNEVWLKDALDATLAKHHSYGDLAVPVFESALNILVTTLAQAAGGRWTPCFQAEWDRRIGAVMAMIRLLSSDGASGRNLDDGGDRGLR